MALKQNNGPSEKDRMAMSAKGIRMMIAGLVVMAAGFLLLSGGGSDDPQVFNYAMFDARRLVAAPIVIIAGIVVEIIAIMGRFKGEE
jgi:hypothetical protein